MSASDLDAQLTRAENAIRHDYPLGWKGEAYRAALIRACRALSEFSGIECNGCTVCGGFSCPDDCDAEWARQVLDVLEPKA